MADTADTPPVAQLAAVHGRGVVPCDEFVLTADDLGLTRGDGCFDATRVVTGQDGSSRVDHLEAHLERLDRSITGLGDQPDDLDLWRELVRGAVGAWTTPGEATLKLMYTRGLESRASEPTRLLTITQMAPAALAQRRGIRVVTLPRGTASDAFADARWLLGGVKTLSYAVNKMALREAAARGADDVLFTSSDGYLLEGPTAALVAWLDDGLVTTPVGATGILDSITRRVVFEAAGRDGVPTSERLLRPSDLDEARGAWLVSSVRGAAPLLERDGSALPVDAALTAQVQDWAGFGAPGKA